MLPQKTAMQERDVSCERLAANLIAPPPSGPRVHLAQRKVAIEDRGLVHLSPSLLSHNTILSLTATTRYCP